MRPETGQALLASSPQLRPSGPTLSALVGRVAESRGLDITVRSPLTPPRRRGRAPSLSMPSPGLITAPPAHRRLDAHPGPVRGLALVGAHGGAGVSSLLRAGLDLIAVDANRRWPSAGAVVLVARTSTSGLEWARDAARQHASGLAGDVELLGLVLVPDAAGRLPARTAGLRDLVTGAFARTWHMPWLHEWRMAAATEPLPTHPDVQQLTAALVRTLQPPHPHLSRTTPSQGDLQ